MDSQDDLLKNVFLDYGRKNNLSEELLEEVFNLLIDAQFIPDGEREHIESQLKILIKKYSKG
tara:strand:+ start:354 stop:539 length:186 start_codon:yes stop_codon:yes gene_type:complete